MNREAFDVWWKDKGLAGSDSFREFMWELWQAAIQSVQPPEEVREAIEAIREMENKPNAVSQHMADFFKAAVLDWIMRKFGGGSF